MTASLRTIFLALFMVPLFLLGQSGETDLANQYFKDGEWQNALNLYAKLQRKEPTNRTFNQRIPFCHAQLEQYEEGVGFLDKTIRKNPSDHLYPFLKADLLKLSGDIAGAEALQDKTIENDLRTEADFMEIGTYFYKAGRNRLSLKTYLQARKTLRDKYIFGDEIANLYGLDGEFAMATEEYLALYKVNMADLAMVKTNVLNLVDDPSHEAIEQVLLKEVNDSPQNLGLRTLVFEFYVLVEEFYEAFLQVKSIDRVFKENGNRVYTYAKTLRNNKEYKLSNKTLDYIIENHEKSPYYRKAYQDKTVNNELQAFESIPLDTNSIREAVVAYEDLLKRFGRKPQFFQSMYRKANLQAFYLFDLKGAQFELDRILQLGLPKNSRARANLLYGDVLLMQKEYNKSKLRYNEVAEAIPEGQIGALAKFKQGRLSYFKGDFETSQARLKTIKDNTTNDISNDAIQLFLLIQDNVGLDTTTVALERFAQAQLMVFQRDFEPALELLDSIMYAFPNHGLADEILWEKANIFLQRNDIDKSMLFLDKILTDHPMDIYGDDALYTKAQLFDYTLKEKEKAMDYYIEFLRNYTGSLYIVEVRKRIRELRNEKI